MGLFTSSESSLRRLAKQIGDEALAGASPELTPDGAWTLLETQLAASIPADVTTVRIAKRNGLLEIKKKGPDQLPGGARSLLKRHNYESRRYIPETPSGGAGGYWQQSVQKTNWVDLLSRHETEVRACFGISSAADPETTLALLAQALVVGALEPMLKERYVEPLQKTRSKQLDSTAKEAQQRRRLSEQDAETKEAEALRASPYRSAFESALTERPPLSALETAASSTAPGTDNEIDGPGR